MHSRYGFPDISHETQFRTSVNSSLGEAGAAGINKSRRGVISKEIIVISRNVRKINRGTRHTYHAIISTVIHSQFAGANFSSSAFAVQLCPVYPRVLFHGTNLNPRRLRISKRAEARRGEGEREEKSGGGWRAGEK